MRFYTFIKNYARQQNNSEVADFVAWYENSAIGKNNRHHAGILQIVFFLRLHASETSLTVKNGFGQCLIAYAKEPNNLIPKDWKNDPRMIAQIVKSVHDPIEDDYLPQA